ncbi:MAG: hypothetical protein HKN26_16750 [Acidimicrobiales bacterium]|nr:hypothetical protein [Acidimicrobiales bacterium]
MVAPRREQRRSYAPLYWIAAAALLIIFVGAAAMLVTGGGPDAAAPSNSLPFATLPDQSVPTPGSGPATSSSLSPSVAPTVAPTGPAYTAGPPPTGVTVPPFPGEIRSNAEIIQFRDDSTVEYLTLENVGGGEADWQVSVGAASGLRLSQTGGRLRAGDTVNVEINLVRESGPDVTDWSTQLVVLGGGTTRPERILVQVFEIS